MSFGVSRRAALSALLISMAARPAFAIRSDGPPLWLAQRGEAEVYLFGSMPTPPQSGWLTPKVEHAFAASADYWLEMPEIDPVRAEELNRQLGMNPERPLSQELGEADNSRLRALLERNGLAPDSLENQRPWLAYLTVSGLAWGDTVAEVPERVLKERARAEHKRIVSEWRDVDELTHFSAAMPLKVQIELLRGALSDADNPPDIGRSAAGWLKGDLRAQEERATEFSRTSPDLYEELNVKRNRRWAERVHRLLDQRGTHFICIGIGHLIGPGSVPELASAFGVDVRRIV